MPGTLEGVDELIVGLNRMGTDLQTRREVHLDAARPIYDQARRDVPVRSGRLRRSGRLAATGRGGRVVFGRQSVPWAGPVHFGHFNRPQGGFIRPVPFLYDAADERADEVVDAYAAFVDRSISRL